VYCYLPPGYQQKGKVVEVLKALYGFCESPLDWYIKYTSKLDQLGFVCTSDEKCLWYHPDFQVFIFFHVDDSIVAGPPSGVAQIKAAIWTQHDKWWHIYMLHAIKLFVTQACLFPAWISALWLRPLHAASDALYADNPGRLSSQGYLFRFFGAAVVWNATKQRTVATSTTEAELLALSAAARELIATIRCLQQLGFKFNQDVTIVCDNKQTVDITNKDTPILATKLRHVYIHQHWLRQLVHSVSRPWPDYYSALPHRLPLLSFSHVHSFLSSSLFPFPSHALYSSVDYPIVA